MSEKSWSQILSEQSPELADLSAADTAFLEADTALPPWIKYLMAMQLDAIANRPRGVRHYAQRARELGVTQEQVVEAVKMLRIYGGRPAMVTGAEALRDE